MQRKKSVAAVLEEIERRIDNSDLLSEEDKQAAREKAREHVLKARKEKATEAYFKAAVREEERSFELTEQFEDFVVDLPEYAPMIKINNVGYYHGCVYEVPYSTARSMADMQARAWEHEREWRDGKHRVSDATRRPQHLNLSPNNPHGRVTTTANMRMPRI
jgi:hypothetical protein